MLLMLLGIGDASQNSTHKVTQLVLVLWVSDCQVVIQKARLLTTVD